MTDTREKLIEAKYFLERMIENQSERNAFKYNLSAFLSAAQSVTYVMQGEFSKVSGFKQWYDEKQTKMQGDSEMKLLHGKRVMTIHQKLVKPAALVTFAPSVTVGINVSASAIVTRADGTVEKLESKPETKTKPKASSSSVKTEATIEWQWYFHELKDKDVVTICKEYLEKLEVIVEECESRFV